MLSAREREILRLAEAGKSNKQIARILNLSPGTVAQLSRRRRSETRGGQPHRSVSDRSRKTVGSKRMPTNLNRTNLS